MPLTREYLSKLRTAAARFYALTAQPDPSGAIALEDAVRAISTPASLARRVRAFRSNPELAAMLDERHVAPRCGMDDLARFAPGTLGHAVHRFLTDNGLPADFYPDYDTSDDINYFWLRALQTHDTWHALTGFGSDFLGELGLLSFTMAHLMRGMRSDRAAGMMFAGLLLVSLVTRAAISEPRQVRRWLPDLVNGWRSGWKARSMWTTRWEELWSRPIDEVRREFLGSGPIAAASSGPDQPTWMAQSKRISIFAAESACTVLQASGQRLILPPSR